jgi:sulfur carrier protein
MIDIVFNGQKKTVLESSTIQTLIDDFKIKSNNVAIEVDGKIIPRSLYKTFFIKESMNIEMVHFVGGG